MSDGTRWKLTAGAPRNTNTLTCCQKPNSTPLREEQPDAEGNGGDETQAELKQRVSSEFPLSFLQVRMLRPLLYHQQLSKVKLMVKFIHQSKLCRSKTKMTEAIYWMQTFSFQFCQSPVCPLEVHQRELILVCLIVERKTTCRPLLTT